MHYFDLTNEETEALRGQMTCLRSHGENDSMNPALPSSCAMFLPTRKANAPFFLTAEQDDTLAFPKRTPYSKDAETTQHEHGLCLSGTLGSKAHKQIRR